VLRFDPARAAAAARAVAPLVELVEDILHVLPRFCGFAPEIASFVLFSIAGGAKHVMIPSPLWEG
jgi:hypothetical protein